MKRIWGMESFEKMTGWYIQREVLNKLPGVLRYAKW